LYKYVIQKQHYASPVKKGQTPLQAKNQSQASFYS